MAQMLPRIKNRATVVEYWSKTINFSAKPCDRWIGYARGRSNPTPPYSTVLQFAASEWSSQVIPHQICEWRTMPSGATKVFSGTAYPSKPLPAGSH